MEQPNRENNDHELAIIPAPPSDQGAHPEVVLAAPESTREASVPSSQWKHVASLIALFSTLFISALNATLVGTATPTICRELNSAAGYAWIVGAYLLGSAAFAPIWAKFSDIWGRKVILLFAVAGFFCSSIICALSINMAMLLAGRALQGTFGGGLFQLIMIVISDLFSMRHRSLYIGLLQIIWFVAGGVGPVLGGAFSQELSWRLNFWIMLPPSAIAFLLLFFALEVHNPHTGLVEGILAVDWAGSFCILALLIMLLLGLNFGGVEYPWSSPTVICLVVFGTAMSALFIVSEKKFARYPLLPLNVFTRKSTVAVLIVAFAHDFAFCTGQLYVPFFFQSGKLLDPINAGTLLLPLVVTQSLIGMLSGFYIHRTGRYTELMWIGQILMAAGYGSFICWDATSSLALLCGTQILAGIGTGMLFSPPLIALQAHVPQSQVATATATVTLVRNIAMVLAGVTGQSIFQNAMDTRQDDFQNVGLDPRLMESFAGSNAAASVHKISTITDPAQKLAVEQAFSGSLMGLWILDVSLLAVGLLGSVFIVKRKLSNEHVESKTGIGAEEEL